MLRSSAHIKGLLSLCSLSLSFSYPSSTSTPVAELQLVASGSLLTKAAMQEHTDYPPKYCKASLNSHQTGLQANRLSNRSTELLTSHSCSKQFSSNVYHQHLFNSENANSLVIM